MSLESGWRCKYRVGDYSEWTYEGGRKRISLVVADGDRTRYQFGMHLVQY